MDIKLNENGLKYKEDIKTIFKGDGYISFRSYYNTTLAYPVTVKSINTNITLYLYQTNQNFNGQMITSQEHVIMSELLSGRGITADDIDYQNKVIIIDSILNKILFQENGIGKSIRIPIYGSQTNENNNTEISVSRYEIFKVIGIYKNTRQDYINFNRQIKEGQTLYYNARCYIPESVDFLGDSKTEQEQMEFVYLGVSDTVGKFDRIKSICPSGVEFDCYTYESFHNQMIQELSGIKKTLNYITLLIMGIAVILIAQTMIFSIKENISDYGIKKAIGASSCKISMELISEMLLYTLTAFIISIVLSLVAALIALKVISLQNPDIGYSLILKEQTVLLSFVLAIETCLIASIFPILYLDNRSVVDIIKFE
ncbi:MAG: ABC transporter permease [Lachnospiraceae bacterium]|nr:ABC transporter permease [Lachnospiraceae bacterium]